MVIILSNNYFLLIKESYISRQEEKAFSNIQKLNPTLLYDDNSNYQSIEVIKFDKNDIGFDKCLLLNGELQLCNENEYKYHETIVHFAAAYIKNLNNVLIIGGGDCMTLREVMKYPNIKNVTMLELDSKVINVSKKYFNVNDYQNDPRVNIIIDDARKSINKVKNNFYDIIIIDTTEDSDNNSPIDTIDFISKCKKKMKESKSILIKNGGHMDNYIRIEEKFKHKIIIKYDIKIWGTLDYKFILGSDNINFDKSMKYKHDIDIKYYDFMKHNNFVHKIL